MMQLPRPLGPVRARVGESTWWDRRRGLVWWVDTFAPALLCTDPATGATTSTPLPELAGGVAGTSGGQLLLALETALFLFDPDRPQALVRLSAPPGLPSTHRFNDLTVDPASRLVIGTVKKSQAGPPEPTGTLYSFDGTTWRVLREGLYTLNGLAFAPSGNVIYYSDSHPSVNRIWRADYDRASGALGIDAAFVDMSRQPGRPDGAATDREGGYWIAAIDGGCLLRFRPDGRLERRVDLPVTYPTKPAFGGLALDRLFVTSLATRPSSVNPELAGALVSFPSPFIGHPVPEVSLTGSS